MSDDPVKVCEKCGEPVRRLLFPVAIQFKGDGFYTTDYARRSAIKPASQQANGGGESEAGSHPPDGESSTIAAKPEAAKAEAPKAASSTPAVSANSD
jgi:hypothetical protein